MTTRRLLTDNLTPALLKQLSLEELGELSRTLEQLVLLGRRLPR